MYVCVCKAVTDSQVEQSIHGGADTLEVLQEQLGVGSECGRCCEYANNMLRRQTVTPVATGYPNQDIS
ncbi:MAG TPA: bacterioferritin [Gammaproteobacteria bacterium]|jgi:bacterioferritin-associated ferredoxin|nr:bacterioferritin [Gammaproteobacteria bacterium]